MITNSMKLILCLVLISSNPLFAQLKVGDVMPEHEFTEVINSSLKSQKLSDFKGKLVILDIWGISCSSCIDGFAHMQSLQNLFGDKIKLILVNHKSKMSGDSAEKILKIIRRMESRLQQNIDLPCIINDEKLDSIIIGTKAKMSVRVGYQIWISPQGKVIGITAPQFVTERNIEKALNGTLANLPVYPFQDPKFAKAERNVPYYFKNFSVVKGDSSVMFHNEIAQGAGTGDANSGYKGKYGDRGQYYFGHSLIQLYQQVYSDVWDVSKAQKVVYQLKNKHLQAAFQGKLPIREDGIDSNFFSYDSYYLTPITPNEIRSNMQNTLDGAFGKLYFQKTMTLDTFLVFKSNSKIEKLYSKGGEPSETFSNPNSKIGSNYYAKRKFCNNVEIGNLLNYIAYKYNVNVRWYNYIDQTNIKQNIDFELPNNVDISSREKMIAYWKTQGLELTEVVKKVDAVLVTDEKSAELLDKKKSRKLISNKLRRI